MKCLLTEDDENLGLLLSEYLSAKGFEVSLAKNGDEGLSLFTQKGPFDLCILDVMMPKKDGFTLAKDIRSVDEKVPIIFLTAKSMKEDTIMGFKSGADDYLTKPFSMEELLLRIEAVLRRTGKSNKTEQDIYQIGKFSFNTIKQELYLEENTQKLTTKETELLKLLCQNLNKPLSRSFALKLIWGDDSYFNARSMDVYITKLRKLLKQDPALKILNLHGEGFKLID